MLYRDVLRVYFAQNTARTAKYCNVSPGTVQVTRMERNSCKVYGEVAIIRENMETFTYPK
jgi:hypothetical protein